MKKLTLTRSHHVAKLAALFAAFFTVAPLAYADYQSAAKAYVAKDYDKAIVEFRGLAELGHADSQYALGVMYYQGLGASKNSLLAYGWIRLAADAGNTKARDLEPKIRAQMEEDGVERARSIVNKFAPDAINSRLMPKILENCEYQNAVGPKPIDMHAPAYPRQLLNEGRQGYVLFEFYVAKDGTVRDVNVVDALPRDAFESTVREVVATWRFKPALRNGQPFGTWAATYMNFRITDGKTSDESIKTIKKIKALAEEGDPNAQYLYGLILSGHVDYLKPWSDALPWMLKAAQGGSAPAQYRVGQSLLRGRGCEQDGVKGAEWLLRSAQQDYADAQVELSRLALKTGPNYDSSKALFWLERAIAAGDEKAKKYLAAVLAASPVEQLRDPTRALDLIDAVLKQERGDISAQEIKASALAATGKYEQAAALQTKAIAVAKKRQWDLTDLNARLESYQSGKPWYGDLLAF
jgi:uncharacterized protein